MRVVDKSKPLGLADYRFLRDGGEPMPRPLVVYADEDWTEVELSALKQRGAKFVSDDGEGDDPPDPENEEDEEDEEGFYEEEREEEFEDNYEEWTNNDLKAELEDRGLETKGLKKKLIERLREDDSGGEG